MYRYILFLTFSFGFSSAGAAGQQQAPFNMQQERSRSQTPKSPPNILFIAVDDLRPELGCYGNELIHSPNLDRLASRAVVFRNHFVTVPTCGPSRYSLLTGRLPRSQQELSNAIFETRARDRTGAGETTGAGSGDARGPESFVEQLRRNGYYTVGIGKVSHSPDGYIYGYTEPKGEEMELPASWDEMLLNAGKWGTGWNAFFGYADGSNRNDRKKQVKPYEKGDVNDLGYPDGLTANLGIEKLNELAGKDQPFFLGLGFFKPHLPFNAPQKYWDLYNEAAIPLTSSPDIPENVNAASLHGSNEFNQYQLGEEKASLSREITDAYARKLKHAYYASVSYTDAQIGRVLDRLKELGLDKTTIVMVWGDHGWHLGDDRVWGKHTIFEWSLRSPLIVSTPDRRKGAHCDEVVSSVDIYPTLMELCGIDTPDGTDGSSFAGLLKKPRGKNWDNVAYSYFRKGITMRTPRYRLTRYFREEEPVIELYDHRTDPYENHNISGEHPELVETLMPLLEKGNTGLYKLPD